MSLKNCRFHQKGHCYNKSSCKSNHDIKVCPQNLLCNQKDSCQFRHVKLCPKFPYCGFQNSKGIFILFKKCSYYHPPPPHVPPNLSPPDLPLHHPPPILLPQSPTTNTRELDTLKISVQKLETELAAVKNMVTYNAARRAEVTPQITSDNIEMQNLINKKAGDTEVHSSSDEHNDSVKLDNILTVSEDIDTDSAPGDNNGEEAPGGSKADNLKSKQVRHWWKKSKAQPPPTQLHPPASQPSSQPSPQPPPTQLRTQLEHWHNTLSDLSKSSQHLETKITTTMLNSFKDLELKMQQKFEEDLSAAIKGTNDSLVTGIAHVTERVRQLEENAPPQDLLASLQNMEKTAKCTEKHSEDIKRVFSDITGMKTSRQQITQNITTNADLITKLQDRIDQVEKHTEDINETTNNLVTEIELVLERVRKLEMNAPPQDLLINETTDNLVTEIDLVNERVRKLEMNWYPKNTEDYPVEKCKNCKRNPCLHEMPVTIENFVNHANFNGSGTRGRTHGYTYIDNRDNTFKFCWTYDHNQGQVFTQTFNENVKSLRFTCHT